MLEIYNGALLMYFTSLCFASSTWPYILKPLWLYLSRHSAEEKQLLREIGRERANLRCISAQNQFAAHSKLQRHIIKLETDLKNASNLRTTNTMKIKMITQFGFQALVTMTMVVSSFWYRYEPLVIMRPDLTPFASALSYPTGFPNAISPHAWVLISNFSMRFFLKKITG